LNTELLGEKEIVMERGGSRTSKETLVTRTKKEKEEERGNAMLKRENREGGGGFKRKGRERHSLKRFGAPCRALCEKKEKMLYAER